MKHTIFKYIGLSLILLGGLNACKVESENIFTMFSDTKVVFTEGGPYSVTENTVLNDGDSVYINFTISASEDMLKIVVDSTRGNGQIGKREFATKENERRSYSGTIKHKMVRDGKITFRFYALDRLNNYMGDGYTSITLEGVASYNHIPNRRIYTPVAEDLDVASFFSISRGASFSYSDGFNVAADIDFCIDTLMDHRPAHSQRIVYNFHSLSADVLPIPYYDLSNWEKRATVFSAPIANSQNTFEQVLTSGLMIENEAKKVNINLLRSSATEYDKGLNPGSLVYFLTPEGKYGAFFVRQIAQDTEGADYLNVSVKIQK